jgi:hypothetical protein
MKLSYCRCGDGHEWLCVDPDPDSPRGRDSHTLALLDVLGI